MSSLATAYRFVRNYVGPVKGLVLDLSGTTCDKYVIAPARVFFEVFQKYGIPVTMEEARIPMGLRKDLHIIEMLKFPEVQARWQQKYGRASTPADAAAMYKDFIPMQLACLRNYGALIPGTAETINNLRKERGIKVGLSTGFSRAMVDVLLEECAKQGFVPDASVAGDDVVNGARPKPFMLYKNLDLMDIHPIQAVVKVDDTAGGVGEGLEAGCWAVGVARYSNYMNINTLEEEATLSKAEIERRVVHSRDTLRNAGAHYVVDDLTHLPAVIDDIEGRLARGETP